MLLLAVVAAIVAAMFADARSKKPRRTDPQKRYEVQTQTPSLNGRTAGGLAPAAFEWLGGAQSASDGA
jgi:hypothetical protein